MRAALAVAVSLCTHRGVTGKLAAYGSGKSPPVLLALNASVPFPTSPSLASSAEEGTLAVFNPLAWERTTAVSVRLPSQAASSGAGGSPSVTVVDSSGKEVASQLDQQGMLWFLAEVGYTVLHCYPMV